MRKGPIGGIFIVTVAILLLSGCSATRKSRSDQSDRVDAAGVIYTYGDLQKNNISGDGFFIQKLRMDVSLGGVKDSYTANLRKSSDGQWLASIQLLRIEIFRVYADEKNVIILDRIGRKATILEWPELTEKYGITYNLLPLLLGDLPEAGRNSKMKLACDSYSDVNLATIKLAVMADCNAPRASQVVYVDGKYGRDVHMTTEEIKTAGNYFYSSVVRLSEGTSGVSVRMRIDEITVPWEGKITFSVPTNYKIDK